MENIKNSTKKSALALKMHYERNRKVYFMGVVAIAAIALQQSNRKAFYAFLESKGIDPMEYYCPEAYFELNQTA